ncbi:MAG TPA: polysaccharide biosynthesis C-terminal domain-containing protein [Thermoleophilaceae bacterium]|nr:polysaccharide biosynthesis C-terminal domain-containing protein [Thermoleophilaceae bacterium]
MPGPGVAEPEGRPPGPGEARLLARGALLQQVAQGSGLGVLLVVVTLLARRLSVPELGAYGLVASLAGYLLVFRNSVSSSAVRAMAAAVDPGERGRMFSAAAAMYAAVGLVTGLLIVLAGLAIAGGILSGDLARESRIGAVGLGAIMAAGLASTVYLDALRAERMLVRAPALEIAGVALHLGVMLALILSDASLGAIIALSGGMPLMSGLLSALTVVRLRLPFSFDRSAVTGERMRQLAPVAGWLMVVELSNLVIYAFGRIILGALHSPATVGRYEGPVRAHNLLYALVGALAVPTVPTASRYTATGDRHRLRELALRGSRYTLALIVPVCVVLIALAEPILEVWLGERYGAGAGALSILSSYWLLYAALLVTPGFLVGAGRARELARVVAVVAVANLALTLALTPELGLEGPALGTAIPFALAFPLLLRLALGVSGLSLGELARQAWFPAYTTGAVLAAGLVALRLAAEPDSLGAVLAAAACGLLAYWIAFYLVWLRRDERELVRGLGRLRPAPARPGPR